MPKEEPSPEEWSALREARPSWQTDGLGVNGPVVKISNTKADLNWDSKVVYRRPELNASTS